MKSTIYNRKSAQTTTTGQLRYERADRIAATTHDAHDNEAFRDARDWLREIVTGKGDV